MLGGGAGRNPGVDVVIDGSIRRVGDIVGGRSGPIRRVAFNGQLRAEILLHVGRTEGALEALAASDAHRLFDIMWLERCPILELLRHHPWARCRGGGRGGCCRHALTRRECAEVGTPRK